MQLHESQGKSFLKFKSIVKTIDLKPVEEKIEKIKDLQVESSKKISRLETDLEQYKIEQERKYRDVVRKVLDLDNKLKKKFKLLGESIIKISKGEDN
jgi:hypothetical protein